MTTCLGSACKRRLEGICDCSTCDHGDDCYCLCHESCDCAFCEKLHCDCDKCSCGWDPENYEEEEDEEPTDYNPDDEEASEDEEEADEEEAKDENEIHLRIEMTPLPAWAGIRLLRIPHGLWKDLEDTVIQQDRQFLTEVARNLGLPVKETEKDT